MTQKTFESNVDTLRRKLKNTHIDSESVRSIYEQLINMIDLLQARCFMLELHQDNYDGFDLERYNLIKGRLK